MKLKPVGIRLAVMIVLAVMLAGADAVRAADSEPVPDEARQLLLRFTPADEKHGSDFCKYVTRELGELRIATEGTGTSRTLTHTIVVPPGATYDGHGEALTADAAALLADLTPGEGSEKQRPLFILAPGAELKNVTITYPGAEGIHMLGGNVLDNVTWQDVGEDAASVRSYFPGGAITIRNCRAFNAQDKVFQFNVPCKVRIENFTGSSMGKLVRHSPKVEGRFEIDLHNVTVTEVISAVVQSDGDQCFVRHHGLQHKFVGKRDKPERIFRDIPTANVTEY